MLRNKNFLLVGPFLRYTEKVGFPPFFALVSPLYGSGWSGRNEIFGGGWGHGQEHLSLEPAQSVKAWPRKRREI